MPTEVCVIKIEEYGFLIDIVFLFVLISTRSLAAVTCFYVSKVYKVELVYMS